MNFIYCCHRCGFERPNFGNGFCQNCERSDESNEQVCDEQNSTDKNISKTHIAVMHQTVKDLNKNKDGLNLLTSSTIFKMWNCLIDVEDKEIHDSFSKYFCSNIFAITTDDAIIKDIEYAVVANIVKSESLDVDEKDLFSFISQWIKINTPTLPQKQFILSHIRLGAMSSKFLATIVYQSHFYKEGVIMNVIGNKSDKTKLENNPRSDIDSEFWLSVEGVAGYRKVVAKDLTPLFTERFKKNVQKIGGIKY